MSLDSFLRDLEDKINGITENCNGSINAAKNNIADKSDKYIQENFNDIKYSSDNINNTINNKIDEIFSFSNNKKKQNVIDNNSEPKKVDLRKK